MLKLLRFLGVEMTHETLWMEMLGRSFRSKWRRRRPWICWLLEQEDHQKCSVPFLPEDYKSTAEIVYQKNGG